MIAEPLNTSDFEVTALLLFCGIDIVKELLSTGKG